MFFVIETAAPMTPFSATTSSSPLWSSFPRSIVIPSALGARKERGWPTAEPFGGAKWSLRREGISTVTSTPSVHPAGTMNFQ